MIAGMYDWTMIVWGRGFAKCQFTQKAVLRLLKRRDGTRHDDDVGVFPRCPPCKSKLGQFIMCSD